MRYFAFTVLGLVLLATIGYVVLRINMPTAKLSIHAVRPVGTNVALELSHGETVSWPVWEFAITNSGRAPAAMYTMLLVSKDGKSIDIYRPPPAQLRVNSSLAPGQGTNACIPVPPDPAVWSAEVIYETSANPLERKLSSWLKPVPKLRCFLPNNSPRFARNGWQSGTNVITAP